MSSPFMAAHEAMTELIRDVKDNKPLQLSRLVAVINQADDMPKVNAEILIDVLFLALAKFSGEVTL